MQKAITKEICPVCAEGHLTVHDDLEYRFTFDGVEHVVGKLLHLVCDRCHTSMCNMSQLSSNSKKVREYEATVEGYISPSRILSIREIYELPQSEANDLFAGGAKEGEVMAYAKWECGQAAPTRAQAEVMLKAFHDKSYMAEVRSGRSGTSA
jgi:hypothetical protein